MFDQDLFINAEKNGTFDIDALEKSLEDIKQTSFKYLYEYQRNAIGYKRFDLTLSDFEFNTLTDRQKMAIYPKRYSAYIEADFITERKKLAYKRSAFFNKELNIFSVTSNPTVFDRAYLVFIGGKYFDTINLRCHGDRTEIIIDLYDKKLNKTGVPKSYFDTLVASNAPVTLFFIPNCQYGIYQTNVNVLRKYKNQLSLSKMGINDNLTSNSQLSVFINNNDLLFSSVITDTSNSSSMLQFYNNTSLAFDTKLVYLNIFGFRNLIDQINIIGGNKFFTLPVRDMPIPAENLAVLRNDAQGNKSFAHDISVKMYYPNVYEIIGNTNNDNLTIFIFYYEGDKSGELKYNNELSIYQRIFGDDIGRYINNELPEVLKNYNPDSFDYSFDNFEKYTGFDNHLKYKIDKLKDMINTNPDVLKIYLNNQLKTSNGYLIDVSDIDLASKYRENNFQEVNYENEKMTFEDPRYIFVLPNTSTTNYLSIRFFIDGLLYVPDIIYKDQGYEYYYIPVTIVKEDSIIEIETVTDIEYRKLLTFNSPLEKKDVKVRSDWLFNQSDIYLVDSATSKFIDRDSYSVVITRNGLDIDLDPNSYRQLQTTFSVKVTNADYIGKPIYVYVSRSVYFEQKNIIDRDDIGSVFEFQSKVVNSVNNIRLFKNGRLVQNNLYNTDFDTSVGGKSFVTVSFLKEIGDTFVLDCSPYRYNIVFESAGINTDGFVDLRGSINKPFDLKWYDIYLNGRKLNKNNIDIISPTLLFIQNVESRKNLLIMEKERDPEYFPLTDQKSLSDDLWDTDPLFSTALRSRDSIQDNETDLITELENSIEFDRMRLFLLLLQGKGMLNPDMMQINPDDQVRFPSIFSPDRNYMLVNPDINADAYTRMRVFPQHQLIGGLESPKKTFIANFNIPDTSIVPYPWYVLTGNWSIKDKKLQCTNGGGWIGRVLTDFGFSDVEFSINLLKAVGGQRIIFRFTDENNEWIINSNGSSYELAKRINSTYNVVALLQRPSDGDNILIKTKGNIINIYINSVLQTTINDSFNLNATKFGLAMFAAEPVTYDNIRIDQL